MNRLSAPLLSTMLLLVPSLAQAHTHKSVMGTVKSIDATHIDRLNIGPIPTIKLDWLQPHEGNIVEFLFRARAYQLPKERLALAR